MRDWIVEIAQPVREKEGRTEWGREVVVGEVRRGKGVVFVRDREGGRWVFVGGAGEEVRVGGVVRVGEVGWEVGLRKGEEEGWGVRVDWEVGGGG